jgi:hypothetical protein
MFPTPCPAADSVLLEQTLAAPVAVIQPKFVMISYAVRTEALTPRTGHTSVYTPETGLQNISNVLFGSADMDSICYVFFSSRKSLFRI